MKENKLKRANVEIDSVPGLLSPPREAVYDCPKCKDTGWVDGECCVSRCGCYVDIEIEAFRKTSSCPGNQFFSALENIKEIESGKMSNTVRELKEKLDVMVSPMVKKKKDPHRKEETEIKLLYGSTGHLKTTLALMYAIRRIQKNINNKKYIRPVYIGWGYLVILMKIFREAEFSTQKLDEGIQKIRKLFGDVVIIDDIGIEEGSFAGYQIFPIREIIDNSRVVIFTANTVPGDEVEKKNPELSLYRYLNYEKVIDHFRKATEIEMIGESYRR